MSIRQHFPTKEMAAELGGESDGYVFRTAFGGASLDKSYEMIRAFLQEEGYEDVPLPKDVEELLQFRLATRNQQVLMFDDNGYVHNPVKILFPHDRRKKRILILELYNEAAENHLLRFHRKLK